MASVQFQFHTDKENATSTGIKMAADIQGGRAKGLQAHKTPRKALGSVNEAVRVGGLTQRSRDLKGGLSLPTTAFKPKNAISEKDSKSKQRQHIDKENVVARSKQKEEKCVTQVAQKAKQQQPQVSYCLPEKEYMPASYRPSPEEEDEDILPLSERASTYVHKLLKWRPSCFLGTLPDSDSEEEREHQHMMDELDNLPLPSEEDLFRPSSLYLNCEQLDMEPVEPVELPPLPFIDDSVEEDGAQNAHSILDDSAGIVPHLGSLEMLDLSLPSLDTP